MMGSMLSPSAATCAVCVARSVFSGSCPHLAVYLFPEVGVSWGGTTKRLKELISTLALPYVVPMSPPSNNIYNQEPSVFQFRNTCLTNYDFCQLTLSAGRWCMRRAFVLQFNSPGRLGRAQRVSLLCSVPLVCNRARRQTEDTMKRPSFVSQMFHTTAVDAISKAQSTLSNKSGSNPLALTCSPLLRSPRMLFCGHQSKPWPMVDRGGSHRLV